MENKEEPLQERMSLERTVMANHRTFLAFLQTSMYFLVAGLSVKNLLGLKDDHVIHISLYIISGILFVAGVILFFRYRRKCAGIRNYLGEHKSGIFKR